MPSLFKNWRKNAADRSLTKQAVSCGTKQCAGVLQLFVERLLKNSGTTSQRRRFTAPDIFYHARMKFSSYCNPR
jgi:hypothetical protein